MKDHAPDLNPAELVWRNVKGRELANLCADDLDGVEHELRAGLRHVRRSQALPFAFLRHTGLSSPGGRGSARRRRRRGPERHRRRPRDRGHHRDLEAGVERGTFREDLYYRLWWTVVEVPPLRARRDDIGLPVEHFRTR